MANPTREGFINILFNNLREQDNLDFKEKWIDNQKLAKIILGIANSGGGIIIIGVKENDDGTLDPIGLSQLDDKEKIYNNIEKFLPDTIKFQIYDSDFTGEIYSRIKGKFFQMLLIYSENIELPYILEKNSNEAEAGCIFYRRGTKTIKANSEEIKNMIEKRIKAILLEKSNLELEEHLKQLNILYKYIKPINNYGFGIFAQSMQGLMFKSQGNFYYPKETYDEFITRMIEQKKKQIENVLNLK